MLSERRVVGGPQPTAQVLGLEIEVALIELIGVATEQHADFHGVGQLVGTLAERR